MPLTTVRPCTAADFGAVADLFVRVFRKAEGPAPSSMRSYFAELYLGNPWVDGTRPPLVAVDQDDRLVGFLGAIPMPLRAGQRDISAAIGGSFMVDPHVRDPLAAVRLLKRFLGGSQDLALTDTANLVAIRFWQGLDGQVAHFQTMRWVLALRPAALGLALAARDGRRPFARAVAPAARIVDNVGARRWRPPVPTTLLRLATAAEVYEVCETVGDDTQLRFAGTLGEFEWLVDMMRRRTRFGPLQLLTLHGGTGAARGAAIFFPNRRGIGQLALATAGRGQHGALLAALRRHAFENGSVGVMGHADSRLAMELRHMPVAYLYRNDFTVVHARDRTLLDPLLAGDVAMTRLTGEWWTRMQGDIFD